MRNFPARFTLGACFLLLAMELLKNGPDGLALAFVGFAIRECWTHLEARDAD